MTEVTLHGYPVKVWDRVWSFTCGELVVTAINQHAHYPIITNNGSCNIDGELYAGEPARIFWQQIDPAAIEAAKVKPKPVEYSYRWYSHVLDRTSSRMTQFEWNGMYVKHKDDENNWVRIEESKREVK